MKLPEPYCQRLLDGEHPMKVIWDFKNMGLESLSEATGFSVDWLENVEAKVLDPTLDQAEALAMALGVDRLSMTGPIFDCDILDEIDEDSARREQDE